MKKKILLPLAVLALYSCKNETATIQAEYRQLTSAVYASGTLVPEDEYTVWSAVDGYLLQSLVTEGDTVAKGQLLFVVENDVRNARTESAEAHAERTRELASENSPGIQELQGRLSLAEIKMKQDSIDLERYENLENAGAVSLSALENARLKYQSSLRDFQNLQKLLRKQKLQNALQLQQAESELQLNRTQNDVGNLYSFQRGIVYDIYRETGDLITPAQPLALIGSENLIARLAIDEDDLENIKLGQKVLITLDAFEDRVFSAHIRRIYPRLNKVEQSFYAEAEFDEKLPSGIYGLNLEANIILVENKMVLAVPRSALMAGDSIQIMIDDEIIKKEVKKGIYDENWVEIISGLDTTAQIVMP